MPVHGHENQPSQNHRRDLSENEKRITRLEHDILMFKRGMIVLCASLFAIAVFSAVSTFFALVRL